MADSSKSFFSGLSGFLAGIAGLITAVVAAAGLAVQQGWVGGGSGDGGKDGKAAVERGVDDAAGDRSATSTATAEFAVEPTSISFQPVGSRDAEVRVRNTGEVPLRLDSPTITGDDAERFDVDEGTCQDAVPPGRSCALRVSFDPKPGSFAALLVVEADQAAQAREVPVKATGVL